MTTLLLLLLGLSLGCTVAGKDVPSWDPPFLCSCFGIRGFGFIIGFEDPRLVCLPIIYPYSSLHCTFVAILMTSKLYNYLCNIYLLPECR